MKIKLRVLDCCWIGFLLLVLIRSLVAPAESVPLPLLAGWLALLLGAGWAAIVTQGQGGLPSLRERLAWAYYPLAMNVAFMLLGPTVKRITHWRADAALQAIDRTLIGENLSLRLQPLISGPANEVFSFSYMFFMVLLFGSLIAYWLHGRHVRRFYSGLFTLYGIGFCGYTLVPAAGPYVAMSDQFATAIGGGLFTDLNVLMVTQGSNHVDVFPSLHIAVSTYTWFVLRRDCPRLALAIAPLVVLLWLSTLYLRYHYLIDIVAGFALAALCLRLTDSPTVTEAPIADPAASDSQVLEPQ